MLPVSSVPTVLERSPVPATTSGASPPALLRPSPGLVGLAGASVVAPLALAAGVAAFGIIDVFWSGVWGNLLRALVPATPTGVGVLGPRLAWALGQAAQSIAQVVLVAIGLGVALVAADQLRGRLRPWDPGASSWFDWAHRTMTAGAMLAIYASGVSASVTAMLVPVALWACRPAPLSGETTRSLVRFTGLASAGLVLGGVAATLFTVFGPVTSGIFGLLEVDALSGSEYLRFIYLPMLRNGLAGGLATYLASGLFLAPLTLAAARAVRRSLPEAPRLLVATLSCLPALVLLSSLINGVGMMGGRTWVMDGLRMISATAPIASLRLWVTMGWAGGAVLPHVAAALLGAGRPLPSPEGPRQLEEGQPSAPGGLLASKASS